MAIVHSTARPKLTEFIRRRVSMFDQSKSFRGWCPPLEAASLVGSGAADVFGRSRKGHIFGIMITRPDFWERRSQATLQGTWDHSAIAASKSRQTAQRVRLEANAHGSHTEEEWRLIVARFGNRCVRCEIAGEFAKYGKLTKDHITPLSEGGTDYASNLQPLCHSCNAWKGNREIDFRNRHATYGG